ncbi:MAG: hypothetical protein K2M91_07900 [Lachnospiraceae bacterium]|nr:hypothetical protein [Lachnospiraceae bacterium]
MNIFNLPKYQWWDYMQPIMQNVNLDKISFVQNNQMTFTFLNSCNGKYYRTLSCSQILKCCIENDAFEDEPFAYFVLDVYKRALNREELESALVYYKYGYPINSSILDQQYNLLVMIGSEICIDFVCGVIRSSE